MTRPNQGLSTGRRENLGTRLEKNLHKKTLDYKSGMLLAQNFLNVPVNSKTALFVLKRSSSGSGSGSGRII